MLTEEANINARTLITISVLFTVGCEAGLQICRPSFFNGQFHMTISQTQKKRILFVDDDKDAQDLVRLTLTDYVIVVAYKFSEGLSLARQGRFDLYILDNWLPDGTGIDLCRQIREFDPLTPILFYTAVGNTKDLQAAFGVGAQEYLIKPVTPEQLTLAVSQWVSAGRVGARSDPECD
jgi:DNA-binding response OmpR family regulator